MEEPFKTVCPDARLHMAIHGFVLKKVQNRPMSTICKLIRRLANLIWCRMTNCSSFTNYCIQHAGIGNKLVTAFAATKINYVAREESSILDKNRM
jgi:hypothetical protein